MNGELRGWTAADDEADQRRWCEDGDPLEALVVLPRQASPADVHRPADDGDDWDLHIHWNEDEWR